MIWSKWYLSVGISTLLTAINYVGESDFYRRRSFMVRYQAEQILLPISELAFGELGDRSLFRQFCCLRL